MSDAGRQEEEHRASAFLSRQTSTTFLSSNTDNESQRNEPATVDEILDPEERKTETKTRAMPKSPFSLTDDQSSKISDQNDLFYQETNYSSVMTEDLNSFDSHWFDLPPDRDERNFSASSNFHLSICQEYSGNSLAELQTELPGNCSIGKSPDNCRSSLCLASLSSISGKMSPCSTHSFTVPELMSIAEEDETVTSEPCVSTDEKSNELNHSTTSDAVQGSDRVDKAVQTTSQETVVLIISPGRKRSLSRNPHESYMHYVYGTEPTNLYPDNEIQKVSLTNSWPMICDGEELLPNLDEQCQEALDSVRELSTGSQASTSTVALKPSDSGVSSTENGEFDDEGAQFDVEEFILPNQESSDNILYSKKESSDLTITQEEETGEIDKPKEDAKVHTKRKSSRRRLRKFLCFSTS